MKERPILFSGEMVRAILDGRKTMTRRILKPQPSEGWTPNGLGEVHKMKDGEFILRDGLPIVAGWGACNADGDEAYVCPYGQPGDRLWVRETWGDVTLAFQSHENEEPKVLAFRADEGVYNAHSMKRLEKMSDSGIVAPKWKPAIFLPRRFSRITLEITNVRVERLREISEEDAEAEGVAPSIVGQDLDHLKHRTAFQSLWDSINGQRASWESNPWVWAVEFQKINAQTKAA